MVYNSLHVEQMSLMLHCALCHHSLQHICQLQTEHLRAERDVLRLMKFPFVVELLTSFQDEECVYFVMEFSCGGEFFRHLKARGRYV